MRRLSELAGLRLTIILIFGINLQTALSQHVNSNYTAVQEHLVCKKLESHLCVTWHLSSGADPDTIIEGSPLNTTQFCGLSDLKRILPHRKFITVKSLAKDGKSKILFCKGFTKLRGNVINWKQVEKALNALRRTRRQTTFYPKGRYRGQTQSQYLAIDGGNGKDEGKAEAHSAADSSRASVSGNSGMGQAQSQSIYDPNCDDCYGKSDHEVASLKRHENGYGPSGSYGPGKDGNQIVGGSNGYRPDQGINTGSNNGHGPGGNGGLGPTSTLGGSPGRYDVYGPRTQQGGNGFGPGHGNQPIGTGSNEPGQGTPPGNSRFGSTLTGSHGGSPVGSVGYGQNEKAGPRSVGFPSFVGSTPSGSLGGSFGPGRQQGESGGYRPGSQQGGTGGYSPGGQQGGSGGYGPGGQPIGNGNYGPGSQQGGIENYGPRGQQGGSGVYGPGGQPVGNGNYRPGGQQGGNGGYGPGRQQGGSENNGPGTQQGGNGGYNPTGQQSPIGGYRPGAQNGGVGSYGPGGQQGGSGGYIPGNQQGGNGGYIPGSQQGGNGGYGPSGQLGGNGGYGTGQRGGTGNTGLSPSVHTTLSGTPGGNSEYRPGQNGGNGLSYINTGGNLLSPNQGLLPNGVRVNTPGQNGFPERSYDSSNNLNPGGTIGYPINQGHVNNGGLRPFYDSSPGGQVPPGQNSAGTSNYPISNIPGQGDQLYVPGQPGTSATGTNANKVTGTNWPLALGPYPGPPGSSIYCCVVPNNYGQNVGSDRNSLPSTGTGYPYYRTEQGRPNIIGGSAPSNLFDRTNGPGAPINQNGIAGTGLTGPGSQNGLQAPGISGTVGPGNQIGLVGTDTYRPISSGGLGGQNGIQAPFGTGTTGSRHQNGIQTSPNYNAGSPAGQGQNSLQGPGMYNTGSPGGQGQNGLPGPGIYNTGSPGGQGQNSLQGPGIYNTGSPGGQGQNSLPGPGIYNTGSTGGQGQNGLQGPGIFDTGLPGGHGQNGLPGPGIYNTGSPGGSGQNGLQGPGIYNTVSPGGSGQNGLQGPGIYNTGSPGGSGQNGLQGPGIYNTGSPGGSGQNGLLGPGIYNTGSPGGSVQNGLPGPGNYNTDSPGGSGQNGLLGPGIYNTGSPGGSGQNGLQGPGNYNTGSPGGSGQNGLQGPGIYNTGSPGGSGQNGLQGPGIYNTGSPGGSGQNGLQGPGFYNTGSPGGQNVLSGPTPGSGNIGTSVGPSGPGQGGVDTSHGPAGPSGGSWNNQVGNNPNIGAIGGPNGHIIPGTGIVGGTGGYPGGTQYELGSRGPDGQLYGGGNTGIYGNQPQGSVNTNPSGTQTGINGPGNVLQGNDYNGIPQNFMDPSSTAVDGDDSEAEASVNQAANGTTASASSKGGNDKGRAQTHVHGTYTGGGSFQAQAQITGENKGAESEVSGGKKGASSSASGNGRNNKSQASVQLGSETGSIQTQSQSNGAMHSSNSQVQGSVKGGMADAQAKGPGSTSSQAQIGFTPYKDGDKVHELLQTPFTGGGVASAQSSGRIGQSQSQLHGTFKYGITYNGAAQSGASLDKDAVFPNRLNFEKIDVFDETQKNINLTENSQTEIKPTESTVLSEVPQYNTNNEESTEKTNEETMKNSESRYSSHTHLDHHKTTNIPADSPTSVDNRRSFQGGSEKTGTDYEYTTDKDEIPPEEYDTDPGYGMEGNDATDTEQNVGEEFPNYEEYSRDYETHQSIQNPRKGIEVQQSTGGNTQHIVLGPLNKHDAEIIQKNSERPDESKVYQPGERVPGIGGYRIPMGFTGSVKSVASKDNTYVVGSKHSPSQAQTVTLTPGSGKINYMYPPSHGKYVNPKDLRSLQSQKVNDDRYVSVSKSVTRALDGDDNIKKQYSHTYYTKSSSCGYFTFTCTMVSGVDGRKKVCKPKIPTNPDGTPIRC